jgi:hypothetical protein
MRYITLGGFCSFGSCCCLPASTPRAHRSKHFDSAWFCQDRNGNGSLSFDEINEAEKKAALFYQES